MKKLFLVAVVGLFVAGSTIGCSSSSASTTTSQPTTSTTVDPNYTPPVLSHTNTEAVRPTDFTGVAEIPTIPHEIESRQNCLSCHANEIPADHQVYDNATCTACHKVA